MRARVVLLPILFAAVAAHAAVIDVHPGPGALQAAIDGASPGDTLRVHAGTYAEAVTVDRRLKLVGDDATKVTIDAGCAATAALSIVADRVTIQDVGVKRAGLFAVDIENRDRVVVKGTLLLQGCGTEEYGINVFQATRVSLLRNVAIGYADAGIYIGGITADAQVRAIQNTTSQSARGLIVEDSLPSVVVRRTFAEYNTGDGIFLHNSDGVVLARNTSSGSGGIGIRLDPTSDDNRLVGNVITGSVGLDVVDEGVSNCWRNTTFTTGTPNPSGC
jgi:parallel beta-helix repeat protein